MKLFLGNVMPVKRDLHSSTDMKSSRAGSAQMMALGAKRPLMESARSAKTDIFVHIVLNMVVIIALRNHIFRTAIRRSTRVLARRV